MEASMLLGFFASFEELVIEIFLFLATLESFQYQSPPT
jgi:hypothetical protein